MTLVKSFLEWLTFHAPKPAPVEVLETTPEPAHPPEQTFLLTPKPVPLIHVEAWCKANGYTDIQPVDRVWYAIAPSAFLPIPLCRITEADDRAWVREAPHICPRNPMRGTFWTNPTLETINGIPPRESAAWNGSESEWVNLADYWNR